MANNRRKYYRRTRKARRRDQSISVTGTISGACSLFSLALTLVATVRSWQHAGNASFFVGSVGLFGLVFAFGAFVLGLMALKERNIRRLLPRTGLILGAVLSVFFLGFYIYGFLA